MMRTFMKLFGWFMYVILMIGVCSICAICHVMFNDEAYRYLEYAGAISGIGGLYKLITVKWLKNEKNE